MKTRLPATDQGLGRQVRPKPNGYNLQLADGTNWFLTCERELHPWLEQLAGILELRASRSGGRQHLLFSDMDRTRVMPGGAAPPEARSAPPGTDDSERWVWSRRPLVEAWSALHTGDYVYAFSAGESRQKVCRIIHMWTALGPIYLQAILGGGLPMHAALAEINGHGVLLAGRGGVGKSTCSRRLPRPWKSWCDDQALLVWEPVRGYQAHPLPTWSDYLLRGTNGTWPAQSHLPLAAIFFLEQASADGVLPLGPGAAAVRIMQVAKQVMSLVWDGLPPQQKVRVTTRTFANACALAQALPAYRLRVALQGRFWTVVERTLAGPPEASSQAWWRGAAPRAPGSSKRRRGGRRRHRPA